MEGLTLTTELAMDKVLEVVEFSDRVLFRLFLLVGLL